MIGAQLSRERWGGGGGRGYMQSTLILVLNEKNHIYNQRQCINCCSYFTFFLLSLFLENKLSAAENELWVFYISFLFAVNGKNVCVCVAAIHYTSRIEFDRRGHFQDIIHSIESIELSAKP